MRIERIAKGKTDVEITIHEGRKRQVKRMCSAVGHEVVQLHRSNFGPLSLGELPEGAWRVLSGEEVKALKQAAGIEAPRARILGNRALRAPGLRDATF